MRIGAVILAAGSGTRMGGVAKALLRRGDPTFLESIVARIIEATSRSPRDRTDRVGDTHAAHVGVVDTRMADICVVVGPPYGDAVESHARELQVRHAIELQLRVVENSNPTRGMGSSVALGFAALAGAALGDIASAPLDNTASGGAADIDSRVIDAAWLWPVDHPDVRASTLTALVDAIGRHEVAIPTYRGRGGHPPLIKKSLFARLAACSNARDVIMTADVVRVEVDDKGTIEDVDR